MFETNKFPSVHDFSIKYTFSISAGGSYSYPNEFKTNKNNIKLKINFI